MNKIKMSYDDCAALIDAAMAPYEELGNKHKKAFKNLLARILINYIEEIYNAGCFRDTLSIIDVYNCKLSRSCISTDESARKIIKITVSYVNNHETGNFGIEIKSYITNESKEYLLYMNDIIKSIEYDEQCVIIKDLNDDIKDNIYDFIKSAGFAYKEKSIYND